MFIVFDLKHVDNSEASEIHKLLLENQIQYQEHYISDMAFSQHYLWVKDHRTFINARKLIDDYYRDNPEYKQLNGQNDGTIKNWYLVIITLFALAYLAVMILLPGKSLG